MTFSENEFRSQAASEGRSFKAENEPSLSKRETIIVSQRKKIIAIGASGENKNERFFSLFPHFVF